MSLSIKFVGSRLYPRFSYRVLQCAHIINYTNRNWVTSRIGWGGRWNPTSTYSTVPIEGSFTSHTRRRNL